MNEINVKILIIGDTNVGKTSLLLRYIDDYFPDKHMATIGVEYRVKAIEYRGFKIKLQLWDTAGQERFHSITKNFFHNADGILFVYDITNKKSFKGVKNWIKESEEIKDDIQKIIVGNKCDMVHQRSITNKEVEKYCKENKIDFIETSAKDNINLKEVFNKIIELIFKDKSDEEIIKEFNPKIQNLSIHSHSRKENKKKVSCC